MTEKTILIDGLIHDFENMPTVDEEWERARKMFEEDQSLEQVVSFYGVFKPLRPKLPKHKLLLQLHLSPGLTHSYKASQCSRCGDYDCAEKGCWMK